MMLYLFEQDTSRNIVKFLVAAVLLTLLKNSILVYKLSYLTKEPSSGKPAPVITITTNSDESLFICPLR